MCCIREQFDFSRMHLFINVLTGAMPCAEEACKGKMNKQK